MWGLAKTSPHEASAYIATGPQLASLIAPALRLPQPGQADRRLRLEQSVPALLGLGCGRLEAGLRLVGGRRLADVGCRRALLHDLPL
jgi:hypothetical protein